VHRVASDVLRDYTGTEQCRPFRLLGDSLIIGNDRLASGAGAGTLSRARARAGRPLQLMRDPVGNSPLTAKG
jgi:hypothetical protein